MSENQKPKFREFGLESGAKIFLGRDAESNDELMKKYKGKENTILHTKYPGSPFGVIEKINPSSGDIIASGAIVAKYSQCWRDYKKDIDMDIFIGKDISKPKNAKKGLWSVKKTKTIKIKKKDIIKFENENTI